MSQTKAIETIAAVQTAVSETHKLQSSQAEEIENLKKRLAELQGAKPVRDAETVRAELHTARGALQAMMKLVEADRHNMARRLAYIESKQKQWKINNPDEPFDPTHFTPPAVPLPHDDKLHREFHRQHLIIGRLERELEAALARGFEV